ncbi:FMN-binding protein [Streptomyces sp. NPDC102395]|uniref:FMN-binding protein n=1 Tax=Streptomyces sp. NPDC102395 TaxID=3366168 RepID=UPI0038106CD3
MKRALPVLVLSIAGLIPVWRYEPSSGASPSGAVAAPAQTTSPAGSSAGPSSGSSVVVEGTVVTTDKGDVQVEVTYEGDRITAVRMLKQPDHPQTTAAVPKLIAGTLQAQSADIDTVSGATVTGEGYKKSLQAAIDARTS